MKQKPPYSNILFSRYIYIYKKLRSDPHHFSTVCWHSYCNRLKTHLRFCINWKTGKELTHLRAHTHTHTLVHAHTPTLATCTVTQKKQRENKKKFKKKLHFFPQRSTCSILEQQVATAGARLPVLAPCALRVAGHAAGLSAGLGPSRMHPSAAQGHTSPVDKGLGHFPAAWWERSPRWCVVKGEKEAGGKAEPPAWCLGIVAACRWFWERTWHS